MITVTGNFKGGVGKTTTTVNLAALAAEEGKKTLVIDNDIQGSAGKIFGIKKDHKNPEVTTLADVLKQCDEKTTRAAIYETKYENLFILPGGMDLVDLNISMAGQKGIQVLRSLESCLPYIEDFEEIFIDNAADLTPCVMNSLFVADRFVIPAEPEGESADGMEEFVRQMNLIKRNGFNTKSKIAGILLTRYSERYKIHRYTKEKLEQNGYPVFETAIHSSVKVAESISKGIPLVRLFPKSRPAIDYRNLYAEMKTCPN